jgi:hypothetical protein
LAGDATSSDYVRVLRVGVDIDMVEGESKAAAGSNVNLTF